MVERFALTDPKDTGIFFTIFPNNHSRLCMIWLDGTCLEKWPISPCMFYEQICQMPVTDYTIGIDTPEQMINKKIKSHGRCIK
jgi:hypothetical protein